jgi:hypothetical protein
MTTRIPTTASATLTLFAAIAAPALAQDGFARARADIAERCAATANDSAACEMRQRQAMGRFVMMMAAFEDADRAAARECLTQAKDDHGIDWTAAHACLRKSADDTPLGGALAPPPPPDDR